VTDPSATLAVVASNQYSTSASSTALEFGALYTALPTGVSVSFGSVGANDMGTMTVTTSASTPAGIYPINITAKSTKVPNPLWAQFELVVGAGPTNVTVTANNQTMVAGGAVPALIYTLSPAVTPTTNPTCTTAATSSSPAGSYPITCSGAVLSGYTFSYQPGTLTVTNSTPTFTLSAAPSSLSLAQDASTTDTITVTSQGGFNSAVALTIAGMPSPFATPKFSAKSVTPAANGSATSSLSLEAKGSTAPGTYTLTVTGKSGPTVVSVPITLTVTAK